MREQQGWDGGMAAGRGQERMVRGGGEKMPDRPPTETSTRCDGLARCAIACCKMRCLPDLLMQGVLVADSCCRLCFTLGLATCIGNCGVFPKPMVLAGKRVPTHGWRRVVNKLLQCRTLHVSERVRPKFRWFRPTCLGFDRRTHKTWGELEWLRPNWDSLVSPRPILGQVRPNLAWLRPCRDVSKMGGSN